MAQRRRKTDIILIPCSDEYEKLVHGAIHLAIPILVICHAAQKID
jgi:gamma-glutamyl-gamma-aminobutyrate hydrolase PuuD